MQRIHQNDMQLVPLELLNADGRPYTETFTGKLVVESNSGPHRGTKIYIDDTGRFIGYSIAERRRWIFERPPDDDELEEYCDSDEEFLAAMLKLGRNAS